MIFLIFFNIISNNQFYDVKEEFQNIPIKEKPTVHSPILQLEKVSSDVEAIFLSCKVLTILTNDNEMTDEVLKRIKALFEDQTKPLIIYDDMDTNGWRELCEFNHLPLNDLKTFRNAKTETDDGIKFTEDDFDVDDMESLHLIDKLILYGDYGYIVFVLADHLEYKMSCLTMHATGTHLFVVEDLRVVSENQILRIFRASFKKLAYVKKYVLVNGKIYYYEPFSVNPDDSLYGQLAIFSESKMMKGLPANMNQFPLNIELFKSVYSVPVGDGGKKGKQNVSLDDFYGPDVSIAEEIIIRMNFSGNFNL